MANSDAGRAVRHVRCPKCHSLLQEPGAPVYQCGGCGATLRAKIRSGDRQDTASSASPSRSGLPPPQTQRRHLGSGDVASTSRSSTPTPAARSSEQPPTGTTYGRESGDLVPARRHGSSSDVASTSTTPDATGSRRQETHMASRRETISDFVSARKDGSGDVASTSSTPDVTTSSRRQATDTRSPRVSGDLVSVSKHVPATEKIQHDQSTTNRGSYNDTFEFRRQRDTDGAERNNAAVSPGVSVNIPRGSRDCSASELPTETEDRRKSQAESPEAARTKHSGEAATVQRQLEEPAPKSAQEAAESKPSRDVPVPAAAAAAAGGGKVRSPRRHELLKGGEEDLAPLREKILKTVDALKGDLSELFSKSPDLNPTKRARPPRLPNPKQEEGRAASHLPARARRQAARAVKPSQVAAAAPLRGLPSRRYRRCRADPPCCDNNAQRTSCGGHHDCCCGHHHRSKAPECGSCRGRHCYCGRPVARALHEPPSAPRAKPPPAAAAAAASKEATKRRAPPRHHCRPVLKGAPFIICSSCFKLVQVPADFAVSTNTLRKLRCGACSAVLSYSYRDPARKKKMDQLSTDGSDIDAYGSEAGAAYAQQQPDPFAPFLDGFGLSSYSTTEDEQQPLHVSRNTSFDTLDGVRGVGRLHRLMGYGSASELLRRSPDLYESFDDRTTPDYDRKGKGVCVDDDPEDDSDDEDGGVLKRSAARGAVWPLPGKGAPEKPGAIRIKS